MRGRRASCVCWWKGSSKDKEVQKKSSVLSNLASSVKLQTTIKVWVQSRQINKSRELCQERGCRKWRTLKEEKGWKLTLTLFPRHATIKVKKWIEEENPKRQSENRTGLNLQSDIKNESTALCKCTETSANQSCTKSFLYLLQKYVTMSCSYFEEL